MLVFLISTAILLLSIIFLVFDYFYIRNELNQLDARIRRFIFGGIELLGFGIILVALSIFGSRELEIDIDTYLIVIFIFVSIIIYIGLLLLWNKFFIFFNKYISKKAAKDYKYKFKSISIYGLVYSFGILFYLLYAVVIF